MAFGVLMFSWTNHIKKEKDLIEEKELLRKLEPHTWSNSRVIYKGEREGVEVRGNKRRDPVELHGRCLQFGRQLRGAQGNGGEPVQTSRPSLLSFVLM